MGLTQVQLWQGQFPPPEAIERYERIQPGAFDRLIAMAEALQAAQASDTKRAQDYAQADTRRGHWLGAVTTWLAMVGAVACVGLAAYTGRSDPVWIAGAFLSVPVMAVAKALIESRKTPPAGPPFEGDPSRPTPVDTPKP